MSSSTPVRVNIAPQLGPQLIGLVLGSVFFGITTLQALFYYMTYPDDRLFLKGLVALLWTLDAASLALITHTVYFSLVLNYDNPLALLEIPWGIASEPVLSATVALIVHWFLSYRVYALRKKLAPLAIFYSLVAVVPTITGLTCTGRVLAAGNDRWIVVKDELFGLAVASNVVSAALDLSIAGTLFMLFRQNNVVFARTGKVLRLLSVYAIATGLFTSLIVLGNMIAQVVGSNTLVFTVFNILTSKAYANALMATLNARQNIRTHLEQPVLGMSGMKTTSKPSSGQTQVDSSFRKPKSAIVFNRSTGTSATEYSTGPQITVHSITESDNEKSDSVDKDSGSQEYHQHPNV